MERQARMSNNAQRTAHQSGKQSPSAKQIEATCVHCGKQFSAPKPYSKYCSLTCTYADRRGKSRFRDKTSVQRDSERRIVRKQKAFESMEAVRMTKRDVATALRRCGLFSGSDGAVVREV